MRGRRKQNRRKNLIFFLKEGALCPMRQQGLPALISSKAQSESAEEGEGEKKREVGSANLRRMNEAPENIGHWPIFRRIEKKICSVYK